MSSRSESFGGTYVHNLIGETRSRYKEKVKMCCGIDPYSLRPGVDSKWNADVFPDISHGDIVNYLVLSTNHVSLEQMKAYKALDAHNYFTSGWVKEISAKEVSGNKIVLLSEVNHSQRLREVPLRVWILCKRSGAVVTAHCTCMAGAGEACSHIGATLFAVETGVRMRDGASCTQKDNLWLPAYVENVAYKRLRDIDFSSSRAKKQRIKEASEEEVVTVVPKTRKALPLPTAAEIETMYKAFYDTDVMPAIFSVLPDHCNAFPAPEKKRPAHLRSLFCEELLSETIEALIQRSNSFVSSMTLTEEVTKTVEATTRDQSHSSKWFLYKAGRITASVMKDVCHTKAEAPSLSTLKKICYPEECSFTSSATTWGLQHEYVACKSYAAHMGTNHVNFSYRKSGLYLSTTYPFLGASPDAVVHCDCCGKGVAEFKCPYSLATSTVANIPSGTSGLDDSSEQTRLKKDHAYFYQVQTQMAVCGVSYCDFVIWSPTALYIERVMVDLDFWGRVVVTARTFFTNAILPELFSRHFTRKVLSQGASSEAAYCFCQGPETGKMIACDQLTCKRKWFHFPCLGLKRAPKSKHWYCPECRRDNEN